MTQSNSNESNVRGKPSFWQNHTVDLQIPWANWSDIFHCALIAKENIDIKSLLIPKERPIPQLPFLKNPPANEAENQKTARLDRKIRKQRDMTMIKAETKQFNCLRIEESDENFGQSCILHSQTSAKGYFWPKYSPHLFQSIRGSSVNSICEEDKCCNREVKIDKEKAKRKIAQKILGKSSQSCKEMRRIRRR